MSVGVQQAVRVLACIAVATTGCRFDPTGILFSNDAAVADAVTDNPDSAADPPDADTQPDGPVLPPDASPPPDASGPGPIVEDIVHVPVAAEFPGSSDLGLWGEVTIDTSNYTIDGSMPPVGVIFDGASQDSDPPGPDLAILHVRALTVEVGAKVRVIGSRPLVIVANGPVVIGGWRGGPRRRVGRGRQRRAQGYLSRLGRRWRGLRRRRRARRRWRV